MRTRADRLGLGLLVGCSLVLAAGAVLGIALERRQEQVDPVTGCVAGVEPGAETTVIIDLTDPLPAVFRAEIREYFRELETEGLRPNERLTLWTLSGAREGALRRRWCRCHPRREANPLVGNGRLAAARSESLFAAPLRRALDSLPTRETAAATPLLEAVQQACSQPGFQARSVPRRLVLVSNLEQNSAVLCVYTHTPNFASFRETPGYRHVLTDLRGASVEVLYVPHGRAAADLSTTLQEFWCDYFRACGAATVRVRRL